MTAIKIGERYRYTRPGFWAGSAGVVGPQGEDGRYEFRTDHVGLLFVDAEFLEPLTPLTPSFSNGDVVKLTSPDGADDFEVRGTVYDDVWLGKAPGQRFSVNMWLDAGWSLEVVEHAPPPIPTEEGVYQSEHGDVFQLQNGRWREPGSVYSNDADVLKGLTLTRLVPEATAS